MSDSIEIGARVKYEDTVCRGQGVMAGVNGNNPALVFVEVDEKDRAHGWFRPALEGEYSFGIGFISDKASGTLRQFWRREVARR